MVLNWKQDFDKRIKTFNKSFNYLEDKTDYVLNNVSNDNFTSFEYKIYNATIGNYIR